MYSATVPLNFRLHSRFKLIVWPTNPPFVFTYLFTGYYIIFTNEIYLRGNWFLWDPNGKLQEMLNIKEQLALVT